MRKNSDDIGLEAIHIEGGLLSSSVLNHLRHYQLPGQTPEDYGIEKGLKLSDELGRYWRIAQARWQQFSDMRKRDDLNHDTVTVENWLLPLLTKVLDFEIKESSLLTIGERTFPITHKAFQGAIPIILTGADQDLEKGDPRFGEFGRKRSPAGLLQEFLNAEESCLWGLVSNGLVLRLLRDNPAMTRPAYVEIDLERLFEEELYVDFTVFWLLLQATRLAPIEKKPEQCLLEQWRSQGQEDGERVLGELRHGVTNALRILGTGFVAHPENQGLREAIKNEELSTDQFFQELLRLIYRFLFLFTTEDRDILLDPAAEEEEKQLYRQGYSISVLRDRSRFRRHYDNYGDGWQQLCITFTGFATGQPLLAQPALGGLFAQDQCQHLEKYQLANKYLYDALFKLCYFINRGVLTRINYRDMDTEELGSVYESLLELIPQVNVNGQWHFSFLGDEEDEDSTAGHARKLTGSYYTPDSLVQELIKSALEPVIQDRLAENKSKPREAILNISVCDPACGSGHFLLAAARRLAAELARIEAGTDQATETNYRHALREVVSHCIYGVDINPLAVELCRTALWLEAIEPSKPLGFLDAHIQVGNSLVGILDPQLLQQGIPQKAFKALSGDDKKTAQMLAKRNKANPDQYELFATHAPQLTACSWEFAAMPEDNLQQVEEKRDAWLAVVHGETCQEEKLRADLYTAAFFAAKTEANAASVPTNMELAAHGRGESINPAMQHEVTSLSFKHRFFHWYLAFPEVFDQGGFDVLLGNPPWDVSQLSETEYFAPRMPSIASLKGAKRKTAIEKLKETVPITWDKYQIAKRGVEASNQFFRTSERFPLTAVGKLNLYALFAELAKSAINYRGMVGVLVPSGIATDDSTKAYFDEITGKNRLVSLFSFENREALFAGVHRSYNFCLLTLGHSLSAAQLTFFATQPTQLKDQRRCFSLTSEEFGLINPNTHTCPVFRSNQDAELTKKIYRAAPILIQDATKNSPQKNPWGIRFSQGLFNMTSASHLFRTYEEMTKRNEPLLQEVQCEAEEQSHLPLYEAKMVHQYDHRWATYETDGTSSRDCTLDEKQNPNYHNRPRYWVDKREVLLRVSTLPKGLVKALQEQDATVIVLGLSHLLFGNWLNQQKERNLETLAPQLFDLWRDFVKEYLFAEDIAPTQLGLCGNSGPSLFPSQNQGFLPAVPLSQIQSNERESTAWYAIDQQALKSYLQITDSHSHLIAPVPPLINEDEALAFAEQLLERSAPEWLMGWRDICRSTDERTVIAGVIPLAAVGHTFPLIFAQARPKQIATLLANLNNIVFDFIARQKVGGTHLTFGYIKQFPVLPPEQYTEADLAYIVPRVLKLTYTSHALKPFAQDLGYDGEPFKFDPVRRHQLKCELDAYYAKLYGLTHDELRYILDPADVMEEDYPSETFRVLKNKEMNEFGEYRTQRFVLEVWDKLSIDETIKEAAPLADFSLYPDTETDRAICAVALALVQQTGGMSSMDHLDTLILTVNPELSRVFLDTTEHPSLDAAMGAAPKALWSDKQLNIRWKECRDHLEARKAFLVRHGVKDQPIETGSEFSTVQANFPGHVDEIALVALNALAKVKELRESRTAATSEQEKILSILDEQHRTYQLAV